MSTVCLNNQEDQDKHFGFILNLFIFKSVILFSNAYAKRYRSDKNAIFVYPPVQCDRNKDQRIVY